MVTVTTYAQVGVKQVKEFRHQLDQFPNFEDMKNICEQDNIRADDFYHRSKSKDGKFYVGGFLTSSTTKQGKDRGLRFLIRCEEKPTYKEMAR